jgi:hypothetical protein
MMAKTQSTTATVSNVGAVCALLDAYVLDVKVEVKADEGGVKGSLRVADDDGWPAAMRRNFLPDPEDGPRQDYEDAERYLLMEHGEHGFAGLLRELAPYLETPLTVLALRRAGGDSWARALTVRPGGAEVEVLQLNG